MILPTQSIASRNLSESLQVDDVQSGNVIFSALQVIAPISMLPETETIHFFTRIAERCVSVWCPSQIHCVQFVDISSNNLNYKIKDKFLDLKVGLVKLTASASTNMIFLTPNGNNTSKNKILYPQMVRCFSVCWCNQRGHLY